MDRLPWLAVLRVVWPAMALAAALAGKTAFPAEPRVLFDMPYAVACRDVTPAEFRAAEAGRKLVEARLEISSLLAAGDERDLVQLFLRAASPERTFTIVDYLPKTQHESIAATPLTWQKSTERSASLGINLSGKYELLTLPGPSAGVGLKTTSSIKAELLPPVEAVAASGTSDRGSGVFFKLKATPRHLLEGAREYALVLNVPLAWRADYLHVHCQAEGIHRGLVSSLDERILAGDRQFVVALYLAGDEEARHIAENFARRQAAQKPSAGGPAGHRSAASAGHAPGVRSPWASLQR